MEHNIAGKWLLINVTVCLYYVNKKSSTNVTSSAYKFKDTLNFKTKHGQQYTINKLI